MTRGTALATIASGEPHEQGAARSGPSLRQRSDADACLAFAHRARGALEGFTAATSLDAQDEELSRVVAKIRQVVAEAHRSLSREIGAIESRTHWGELVVSFFGETNAGKSTILEALTGGRGTTIGDGTKDFTRDVTEYRIEVGTGAPVVLLDMPGVEGVEERVRDAIGAAVGRSHAVFVVVGSKEPERGLLERIRGWLAEQAAVYAVVNARQAPRDPMPPLESAGNVDVRERTRSLLRRELGGFFHGVALVNGRIAFLASGGDLEPRFTSAAEKVARTFLSRQHALGYSGLSTLRREITDLARAAPDRALVANAFKLLSVVQKTSASLLREKKRFDSVVKKAEGQLTRAQSRIGAAVEQ